MKTNRLAGVVVAALVLAACGRVDGPLAGELETKVLAEESASEARLSFDADWNETKAGTIAAGKRIAVDYDERRLPNCRASHNGNPGWQIYAAMQFMPSGTIVEKGIFDHRQSSTGPDYHSWIHTIPVFTVPAGTTSMQMWFRNTSGFDHPCQEYDSNLNANYRLNVDELSPSATVVFDSTWNVVQQGAIVRGGVLNIEYAASRMQSIVDNATSNGIPYFASKYHCYGYGCCDHTLANSLNIRFSSQAAFTRLQVAQPVTAVVIPADAERVEIYFDTDVTTQTWYCGNDDQKHTQPTTDRFYDSNYGKNFVLFVP
jgi:hypothetical protein